MKRILSIVIVSIFVVSCGLLSLKSGSDVTIVLSGSNREVLTGIKSMSLTVEGPGMSKKVASSLTSSVTIDIAPGSDRVFTLDLELESGITYTGTTTVDIAPGSVEVTIPISMSSMPSIGHYSLSVTAVETEGGPEIGSEMALTILDDKISFMYKYTPNSFFDLLADSVEFTVSDVGNIKTYVFLMGEEESVKFTLTFETVNSGTFTIENNNVESEIPYKNSGTFEALFFSNIADILGFELLGSTAGISESAVAISVPFGSNVLSLIPTITIPPGATISPLPTVAQNFTSPVTYTVTAQDGTTKDYTVTVTVITE